jgi:hypothetical protein
LCPGGSVSRNQFLCIESAGIRSFDKDSSALFPVSKQTFFQKCFNTHSSFDTGIDLALGFDSITFRAETWQRQWKHKSPKVYLIPSFSQVDRILHKQSSKDISFFFSKDLRIKCETIKSTSKWPPEMKMNRGFFESSNK